MGLNLVGAPPPLADMIKGSWWQYMTYMTMLERVMTKKTHKIFGQEESATPRENPGYAYVLHIKRFMLMLRSKSRNKRQRNTFCS